MVVVPDADARPLEAIRRRRTRRWKRPARGLIARSRGGRADPLVGVPERVRDRAARPADLALAASPALRRARARRRPCPAVRGAGASTCARRSPSRARTARAARPMTSPAARGRTACRPSARSRPAHRPSGPVGRNEHRGGKAELIEDRGGVRAHRVEAVVECHGQGPGAGGLVTASVNVAPIQPRDEQERQLTAKGGRASPRARRPTGR